MKINWGTGIAIFFTLFVGVLVFAVIKTTQIDHNLVTEEYYQLDLQYQKHYEKLVNSKALVNDLQIRQDINSETLTLLFPEELGTAKGTILFFRPSDSRLDFQVEVTPDESYLQSIPLKALSRGLWKVRVDWQAGGKSFFKEEVISI